MVPDGLKSGRLVFASGLTGIRLLVGDLLPGPVSCGSLHRYDWPIDQHGMSNVVCGADRDGRLSSTAGCACPGAEKGGEIRLNPIVPWEIEIHGKVSCLEARLKALTLCSMDVLGNASQVSLELPKPAGTAYLYVAGNARDMDILRPQGVGIAITIPAGSEQVQLDGWCYAHLACDTRIESAGFDQAASRYEVAIGGTGYGVSISGGKK